MSRPPARRPGRHSQRTSSVALLENCGTRSASITFRSGLSKMASPCKSPKKGQTSRSSKSSRLSMDTASMVGSIPARRSRRSSTRATSRAERHTPRRRNASAAYSSFPSSYFLLPAPAETVLVSPRLEPAPVNLYSAATWREHEWGLFAGRDALSDEQRDTR